MIGTKKKPEKVFKNNPPKKEVPKATGQVDTEKVEGWNYNFAGKNQG